jgi:hypothetical protein
VGTYLYFFGSTQAANSKQKATMNDNSAPDSASNNQSAAEVAAVFARLRALKKKLRPHLKSDQLAIEMIKVIIGEGWDTGPRIVGTMKQLGFDKDHAGITLGKNKGHNPKRHHWWRHEDGRYIVHEDGLSDPESSV